MRQPDKSRLRSEQADLFSAVNTFHSVDGTDRGGCTGGGGGASCLVGFMIGFAVISDVSRTQGPRKFAFSEIFSGENCAGGDADTAVTLVLYICSNGRRPRFVHEYGATFNASTRMTSITRELRRCAAGRGLEVEFGRGLRAPSVGGGGRGGCLTQWDAAVERNVDRGRC